MKDAINYTHGHGCYCRNCEFCIKGTSEDEYWTCEKDILKPGAVNATSFCSSGIPKQECDADPHKDISAAIICLRESVKDNNAEEGYFDVKLKNGKDIRVQLYPWNEFLEVDGLCRRTRQLSDMDIIALIGDDVQHIEDVMVWKGDEA